MCQLSVKEPEARAILCDLKELSVKRSVDPTCPVLFHLGLGEPDEAFSMLERAYADHSAWMVQPKAEPVLDAIRTDARCESHSSGASVSPESEPL